MMQKVKKSLNFIFYTFLIFIFISLWATFYLKNKHLALLLSAIFSVLAYFLIEKLFQNSDTKKLEINKNKKDFENFKYFLLSISGNEFNDFLTKVFNDKISFNSSSIIYNKNVLVINSISTQLDNNAVISACKTAKNLKLSKIAIFCTKANEKTLLFSRTIENFEIEILTSEKLFEIVKKRNISYENIISFKNQNKVKMKTIFCLIFSRKNAKKFAFFGILSFLMSFLTIFKLYYYLITSAFIIFSLICAFRPKIETKTYLID